jgi:hypothetical protein
MIKLKTPEVNLSKADVSGIIAYDFPNTINEPGKPEKEGTKND